MQGHDLTAHDFLQAGGIRRSGSVGGCAQGKVLGVIEEFGSCGLEHTGNVGVVFNGVLFQGDELHLVEDVVDGVLDCRRIAHRASRLGLENVENRLGGNVARAEILQQAVKAGRTIRSQPDTIDGLVGLIPDAVGFDELEFWLSALFDLEHEVFAIDVDATANERLALLEAESSGDLATR